MASGIVQLVGAGPGDPELITIKGLRCLRRADVVIYDRLAAPELLEEAPSRARRISVGKAPGHQPWPQDRINRLLVAEARRGRRVVRLKGGDPFVFGRGGEECDALAAAGVRYEVVPGVSSAIAAPACAGIPVTHRDHAGAFSVVTGHRRDTGACDLDWDALARLGTIVILMGLGNLPTIVKRLREHGRPASTPVAVIGSASTSRQVVVRGDLADIVKKAAGMQPPATVVVGDVAKSADLEARQSKIA